MKKYLKVMLILFVGFIFLTNVKANIIYNNLSVTVDGANVNQDNPFESAKIKYKNGTTSLNGVRAFFTGNQDLLLDSITTAQVNENSNNLVETSVNRNNLANFSFYERIAEKSENVYTALYQYDGTTYTRLSTIVSIQRPQVGLTHRIEINVGNEITATLSDINYESNNKTIHYKIGQITDKTLLNMVKEGTGNTSLLTYSKNASNPIVVGSIRGNDGIYKKTNDLNKSNFTNHSYYYIYSYRDTENGTYQELEDIEIYQYIESGQSFVNLVNSSNSQFSWDNIDNSTGGNTTPDTTPTNRSIKFGYDDLVCAKNSNVDVLISSEANIISVVSSNESIVKVNGNVSDGECGLEVPCYSVSISCNLIGTAKLTAKNEDNNEATLNVEVLESLDPVTITYNSNEGSSCKNLTIYKGQKVSDLCKPTKKGYTFTGWYTSSTGGEKISENSIINENITLYARWTKDVVSNPKTGVIVPIVGILMLMCLSIMAYYLINKKSHNYNL